MQRRRNNFQIPLKQEKDVDGELKVFKIWRTIQGEGPFVGTPAVFVRLYGCNLQCAHCDTDYTSNMLQLAPEYLAEQVVNLLPVKGLKGLVVLTGGEPFRQNLVPFLDALADRECYRIQVETNGTLPPPKTWMNLMIVCSPKTPRLNAELIDKIDHLKYVLSADAVDPIDGLPTRVLGENVRPCRPWRGFKGDVFLQPEDTGDESKNKANAQASIDSCLKHGYRFCPQVHKHYGLE